MEAVTRIEPKPWMTEPDTQAVMAALQGADDGPVALFVGGCVRDTLLGRAVGDIDIATSLPPEAASQRIAAAGMSVVPTGIAHGTITAIAPGRHFEITTLRVDVETHGRHATVAFTDDWAADAARRDFTLNALYADSDGAIYDPVGGLADLQAKAVRFVGDPEQRIREDVLRLLRFFRFYAQLGTPPPDPAALAACSKLAHLLPGLSGERVAAETLKLLATPDPATVLTLMSGNGILQHVLAEARVIDRLSALVTVEGIADRAEPVRRLAALLEPDAVIADAVADRLRLSNADRHCMRTLAEMASQPVGADTGEDEAKAMLYRIGPPRWRDLVLYRWADDIALGGTQDRRATDSWKALFALPDRWHAPEFPLHGQDVLDLGREPGPEVGELLAAVEEWWITGGFSADRAACLAKLAEVGGA